MDFDFGQNTKVKDLVAVPEQFRAFYHQPEGTEGYALRSDDPAVKGAVEAIVGLNRSLKAARMEAQGLKGKSVDLSALAEFGDNPSAIAESVSAKIVELQEAATGKNSKAKLDLEKIKADLAQAHAADTQKLTARIEALQGQLYKKLVTSEATLEIAAQKGDAELLMPFVEKRVVAKEEDGSYIVYVIDEQKNIRYSGVTGQPMTVKELVGELKANEKYGRLFSSEAPAGADTPPGAPSRPTPPQPESKSSLDLIKTGLQKGQFERGGRA
jgi:hypothetical protein